MENTSNGTMIARAMHDKAEAGYLVGPPKLGYGRQWTYDGVVAIPDPEIAPLIARAFVEVAVNGLSLRQVTALMQNEGLKGRRGEPISLPTVQRILADCYYAGLIRIYPKQVEGRHRAIVPISLFEAAQLNIATRKTH